MPGWLGLVLPKGLPLTHERTEDKRGVGSGQGASAVLSTCSGLGHLSPPGHPRSWPLPLPASRAPGTALAGPGTAPLGSAPGCPGPGAVRPAVSQTTLCPGQLLPRPLALADGPEGPRSPRQRKGSGPGGGRAGRPAGGPYQLLAPGAPGPRLDAVTARADLVLGALLRQGWGERGSAVSGAPGGGGARPPPSQPRRFRITHQSRGGAAPPG